MNRSLTMGMRWRRLPAFAGLAGALMLAACSSTDVRPEYQEEPVEQLYNQAMDAMEVEQYKRASGLFDEVERQHPYSTWSTQAQIMSAYAYYQADDYDDAIAALDRFIRLHPANENVPYAHYLIGLSYYERISDVGRDQNMTKDAREAFETLVSRYPDSRYSRDAKLKLDLINDHLAGKEMDVGRYYLIRGYYLAAINRFQTVVREYQTTTHVPEALHRLVEAYSAVGLEEEARKSAAVLGHNFPGSEWYIDSYQLVENVDVREQDRDPWYKFW
jgi:outer membrane protein assembly factor BamD